MDQGYDTNLGEAGNNISGGQRQKIAFARSFYRNFEVLIIDEGTSAMDNISEENIFIQLDDFKDKTIFIVSHRLAFIKNCDFILEFNNGKIVHKGTYEELLHKSKTFREREKLFTYLEAGRISTSLKVALQICITICEKSTTFREWDVFSIR